MNFRVHLEFSNVVLMWLLNIMWNKCMMYNYCGRINVLIKTFLNYCLKACWWRPCSQCKENNTIVNIFVCTWLLKAPDLGAIKDTNLSIATKRNQTPCCNSQTWDNCPLHLFLSRTIFTVNEFWEGPSYSCLYWVFTLYIWNFHKYEMRLVPMMSDMRG